MTAPVPIPQFRDGAAFTRRETAPIPATPPDPFIPPSAPAPVSVDAPATATTASWGVYDFCLAAAALLALVLFALRATRK